MDRIKMQLQYIEDNIRREKENMEYRQRRLNVAINDNKAIEEIQRQINDLKNIADKIEKLQTTKLTINQTMEMLKGNE